MTIKCPNCNFAIELKGVRPGQFSPGCPGCHVKFSLVVHADAATQPTVTKLAGSLSHDVAQALRIKPTPTINTTRVAQTLGVTSAPPSTNIVRPNAAVNVAVNTAIHATSAPVAPAKPNVSDVQTTDTDLPTGQQLGGYEVIQKLGHGGMGAVYLARQVSLERNVALKTLHANLAQDPQLVSRFTREAYAAAQLTHHNIVQIHDIGQEKGINFFSMEFVNGQTLSNVLRESGKLDVETAVTYILQAARGLKFAHDHGLIHRDIKPENLLLNDQGIVKVADLGLVKRVGSNETADMFARVANDSNVAVTQVNKSMGTPLYMPPEQATDAASVDHRADIYSLGCTLYHLITGRPPFLGRTAMEVMTKHQNEPVTPPDVIVQDVPVNLSPIIVKMLAKKPADRYATMKDVIVALEGFLGIASGGHYTPKEEQVKVLEFSAARYADNFWARLRPKLIISFYAACALLVLALAWFKRGDLTGAFGAINLVGGVIGLAIFTTLIYQITLGIMKGSVVFTRARQLVFGAGVFDWLTWTLGLAVLGYVIYAFGLWGPWLFAIVLGVMVSQAFYWTIDFFAARDRETFLRQADKLIRQMRLRGLDETAIRQFVCKFSGTHWEAFYEALFGYEEKIQARSMWGKERGKDRPKHAAWREPVMAYIDGRIEARKHTKEAKLLARLEAKAMRARGMDDKRAQKLAAKSAARMVDTAESMKRASAKLASTTLPPSAKATASALPSASVTAPPALTNLAMTMITHTTHEDDDAPDHDRHYKRQGYFARRYGSPLQFLTGSFMRGLLALLMLAVFANWWSNTKGVDLLSAANEVTSSRQTDAVDLAARNKIASITEVTANEAQSGHRARLDIPLIPKKLTDPLEPFAFAVAGVLMGVGTLFRGRLFGLLMLACAGIALLGYTLALPLVQGNPSVAYLLAAGLWVFSVIFVRAKFSA